jgi:hypothetical protein
MVCFQTKNPNLGKLWRVLLWKILGYFLTIWSILRPLEIFYGHLVYIVVIWYILPRFGILDQEKSGNPACEAKTIWKKVFQLRKRISHLSSHQRWLKLCGKSGGRQLNDYQTKGDHIRRIFSLLGDCLLWAVY